MGGRSMVVRKALIGWLGRAGPYDVGNEIDSSIRAIGV